VSDLISHLAGLTIGTVESVAPNEIKVLLELDAPQTTALNTGVPSRFPRLNGYVLIPHETGAVVGLVTWLGVERSPFPKRTGLRDFGVVDLPFPLRKLTVTPVGTLVYAKGGNGIFEYGLQRGVAVFPSVGDQVQLPTAEQLKSIVEVQGEDQRVPVGISPLAANAVVSVDPDKMFGRHLAVLGNTGSGKSCTVAGLIRWSLERASAARRQANKEGPVNARFVILDPNGEYLETFHDLAAGVRRFRVNADEHESDFLRLPAWMWNSHEWSSYASASPGTQRPLLLQALRELRSGGRPHEEPIVQAKRFLVSLRHKLLDILAKGLAGYTGFPANLNFGELLEIVETDVTRHALSLTGDQRTAADALSAGAISLRTLHRNSSRDGKIYYRDFSETEVLNILKLTEAAVAAIPGIYTETGPTEDAPVPFDVSQLPGHLEFLAASSGSGQLAQWVSSLALRIRLMLADRRLGPIVVPENDMTFEQWLVDYIGADHAGNGQIAIVDLSLVPSDVIHTVVAVIARLVFEATQRYRKLKGFELPTTIVLEEAHTFIQREARDISGGPTATEMCRSIFERIAREGRKFGLGLVLSSQRPSELSPTVLAQCNTFLLHRLVNDRDQELVSRLVPDSLGGLLRELANLPARQAILLGWAAPVPVLLEINELKEEHRPRSSDPHFWKTWTGEEERQVDWKEIADEWTR
jgi:DNA helicase HerA-like ATPase